MSEYTNNEPARAQVDATSGPQVVEFGNNWCGYCRRAQPVIAEGFAGHEDIPHLKIADGPGQPLGRSFRVKLWPTLVFLRDGKEVAKLVRPGSAEEVRQALESIIAPA